MNFINLILNLKECALCESTFLGKLDFCEGCEEKLYKQIQLESVEQQIKGFTLFSLATNEGLAKRYFQKIKNGNSQISTSTVLSLKTLMTPFLQSFKFQEINAIIAVPSSAFRESFNTPITRILNEILNDKVKKHLTNFCIKRSFWDEIIWNHDQKMSPLHNRNRVMNQKWIYPLPIKESSRILMIDDICTTGKSLERLHIELKSVGILKMQAFVCLRSKLLK